MKETGKNRWMVWAIIFLAIMNITTLLTILYHENKSDMAEFVSAPVQEMSESSSIEYSGRYFRANLNLNRDQMNRFVEFNPEFREKAWRINVSLERVRHKMLTEMASKNTDNNKLDMLSDSVGYLHARLKKLTYRYYLDIKNICDKQQQKNLEQLFSKMFTSDVKMGHNGKGGPNGRRNGRQFIN